MKGQRGSVLVGILSLGLIVTLMAGSYLVLAGNSGTADDIALEDVALKNAAESGINLGLRWMRTRTPGYLAHQNLTSMPLTIGTDNFMDLDDFKVRVRITGVHLALRLESMATRGAGRDTCRIIQQIADITDLNTPGTESDLTLGPWQETILPAN